jgi:hypothetical protein
MQATILYGTAWKEDRTAELVRLALEQGRVADQVLRVRLAALGGPRARPPRAGG